MQRDTVLSNPLNSSALFDADWYQETFPDVTGSGLSAADHFLKYGRALGRDPGPDFDAQFYLETYRDAAASDANLLVFHENHPDRARRPTTRADAVRAFEALEAQTRQRFLGADAAPAATRALTYAIAVAQLSQGAEDRLATMLDTHAGYSDQVEILVVDLSPDGCVTHGLKERFSEALEQGALRVGACGRALGKRQDRATDAIRRSAEGAVWVGLEDGDSVPVSATRVILAARRFFPEGFVLEIPAENGRRFAMPTAYLRHLENDTRLLPGRGRIEALALRALSAFPVAPFLAPRGAGDLFSGHEAARRYRSRWLSANRFLAFDRPGEIKTAKPADDADNLIAEYNLALTSLWHEDPQDAEALAFVGKLTRQLLMTIPVGVLWRVVFGDVARPEARTLDPIAIAVRQDGMDDPAEFLACYLGIGAGTCVLIDGLDRGDPGHLPDGVMYLRAVSGDPHWSDPLWRDLVRYAIAAEGQWVVVPQRDDIMRIPASYADLTDLTRELEARGRDFATCLSLSVLPGEGDDCGDLVFVSGTEPTQRYLENAIISAGFGDAGDVSWRFDARFHATGDIHPLAERILFRHWRGRYLAPEQPGMTFVDAGQAAGVSPERWDYDLTLPVLSRDVAWRAPERLAGLQAGRKFGDFRLRPVGELLAAGEDWPHLPREENE